MRKLFDQNKIQGMSYSWTGLALEEVESQGKAIIIFSLGLLVVYLTLSAQYESFALPFIILLAVPMAILGALGLVAARGLVDDVYVQIGLVMLIGLSAKNSILIVEFAEQLRAQGRSIVDAAIEAAELRLRPILMTSIAFIPGCAAALLCERRGRAGAALGGYGGGGWHGAFDRAEPGVYPGVVCAAEDGAGTIWRRKEDSGDGSRSGYDAWGADSGALARGGGDGAGFVRQADLYPRQDIPRRSMTISPLRFLIAGLAVVASLGPVAGQGIPGVPATAGTPNMAVSPQAQPTTQPAPAAPACTWSSADGCCSAGPGRFFAGAGQRLPACPECRRNVYHSAVCAAGGAGRGGNG